MHGVKENRQSRRGHQGPEKRLGDHQADAQGTEPQYDQKNLLGSLLIHVSHVRNLARPGDETNPGVIDSIESTLPGGSDGCLEWAGSMTKDGMACGKVENRRT